MNEIERQAIARKGDSTRAREQVQYQPGFGNHFVTEAVPGALPVGRNSPQRPPTASTRN